MRDYNSILADYSQTQRRKIDPENMTDDARALQMKQNIKLFKYMFNKYDESVKNLKFDDIQTGLAFVNSYYLNIYEMTSILPEQFLDYIKNKLNAYLKIIGILEDKIEKGKANQDN